MIFLLLECYKVETKKFAAVQIVLHVFVFATAIIR